MAAALAILLGVATARAQPQEREREAGYDHAGAQTLAVARDGAIEIDPDGPGGEAPAFEIDDPAFGSRSSRGNLVLRWAFRPGSTLHPVYQHGRERTDAVADLDVGRDLDRLFGEPASHVLVVKASWWLDL